jgi:diaminopimelate decarboxylase
MFDLVRRPDVLRELVESHGSPVNLVTAEPFVRNGRALRQTAGKSGVDVGVYFARKANKCLTYVQAAHAEGWGIDVSGFDEAVQVLECGVPPHKLVVTAAVKPRKLLELIAARRIPTVLDNPQEVRDLADALRNTPRVGGPLPVAIRLSGFTHDGENLYSRFGFDVESAATQVRELWAEPGIPDAMRIEGAHFHLDGYDPAERRSGIASCLGFAEALPPEVGRIEWIDMGGGLPVRYLEDVHGWESFWRELRAALLGRRPPITYRNHGLGLVAAGGSIAGEARSYPYGQQRTAAMWLTEVLEGTGNGGSSTVARSLARRGIALRCEPGRSLLDGAGVTVARVAWVKNHPAGHRIAALEMNRTQCRTSSDDFLVDPLLVPSRSGRVVSDPAGTFLTGAYCIENEMLSWRRLEFPRGLEPGDLVMWPNTAGYFMHFLESRSHQMPLARNLVWDPSTGTVEVDPIDAARASSEGRPVPVPTRR